MTQLKTMKIGNNTFTQKKHGRGNDKSRSFHIVNCESLEFIEIGEKSYSGLKGDFLLKNLFSLLSLQIGSNSFGSIALFRVLIV